MYLHRGWWWWWCTQLALMGVAARALEVGTNLKERQYIVVRYVYYCYVV
jgi:hypothetical protein